MFGIDEKMKRGFLVPVLAIAVCAVAMIGVGFATAVSLGSNVISDENVTAELMLDMAGNEQYGTLNNATHPGSTTNTNEILKITLTNSKEGMTNTFTVTGGWAYIKVFGNLDTSYFNLSATIKATDTADGTDNNPAIGLTLYECDNGGIKVENDAVKVAATKAPNGTFTSNGTDDGSNALECGKIYIVAVTELNGVKINYTNDNGAITGTVDKVNSTPATSGAQNYSVEYTFTASANLEPVNNPAA